MLVASCVLLLALLLYVLLGAYLPAKQRIAGLEAELKEVYARESALQTRLAQDPRTIRDQQLSALRAERDALNRRIQELERELAAARARAR
jgi:predicted  nucleic acid-binding Zn-ribbon protein